jgi:hypothetical protein
MAHLKLIEGLPPGAPAASLGDSARTAARPGR